MNKIKSRLDNISYVHKKEFELINSKIDSVENEFDQYLNRKQPITKNDLEFYLEEDLDKLILT